MEKWIFRSVPRPASVQPIRGLRRERVAIVRRCFDAWMANRFDSLVHDVDPRVEVDWTESRGPYRGIYCGHRGLSELFAEMRTQFAEVTAEPHDFVVQGQHIAVAQTSRMRGRDGVEVLARSTVVFTFLGSKLIGLRLYERQADALAAIGAAAA
jgi:ketosteroid isomerase-like protein